MKKLHKILFILFIILLILPALQKQFKIFKIRGLNGSYTLANYEPLNINKWFDGSFQKQYDKYLEDHVGMRNMFIRIYNQIDFSLFRISHANKVQIGKEDYLFETRYINSYLGIDQADTVMLLNKIRKTKRVQDSLAAKGVEFLIITAPGKGYYYPEYLPEKYDTVTKKRTNYEFITQKFKEYNINNIDFNSYFIKAKDTTQHPLYTQCGVHWSFNSMRYVVDSIINYLEVKMNKDLPDMVIDSVEYTTKPRFTDYDIGDALNIYTKISDDTLLYPTFSYKEDTSFFKPRAIIIGDSYYWQLSQSGGIKEMFNAENFWYYFKEVYREKKYPADMFDIKTEIENSDLVILLTNEAQSHDYDCGFVNKINSIFDQGWDKYQPLTINEKEKMIQYYIQQINSNSNWLEQIKKKARKNNITVEKQTRLDAEYMVEKSES